MMKFPSTIRSFHSSSRFKPIRDANESEVFLGCLIAIEFFIFLFYESSAYVISSADVLTEV